MKLLFHGTDVKELLKIKGRKGYGVSLALARGDALETFCAGSGRYGEDFPVNPDMLFQAAMFNGSNRLAYAVEDGLFAFVDKLIEEEKP